MCVCVCATHPLFHFHGVKPLEFELGVYGKKIDEEYSQLFQIHYLRGFPSFSVCVCVCASRVDSLTMHHPISETKGFVIGLCVVCSFFSPPSLPKRIRREEREEVECGGLINQTHVQIALVDSKTFFSFPSLLPAALSSSLIYCTHTLTNIQTLYIFPLYIYK